MPAAVRLGDTCSGHGCFPPRPTITAASKFIVEGAAAHRVGDQLAPHTCVVTHGGVTVVGSSKFIVEGTPIARIGDAVDCGSVLMTGASKFFVEA